MQKQISRRRFLDIELDPRLDLFCWNWKAEKEKNAIIPGTFQEPDIQDVADYIGDSLGLAQKAEKPMLISHCFCRCAFHGETAMIKSR